MVLKAVARRIIKQSASNESVDAIRDGVKLADTSVLFWKEALHLAKRTVNF